MELKQYLKLIQKNITFIGILTIVGLILGLYSAKLLPSGYKQSQVFFVTQSTADESPNTLYKQDRALNYTDSAVSIIQSDDFLLSAQISQSTVEVKKLAPQVIKITLTSQSREKSTQDLSTILLRFNEKTEQILQSKTIQLTPIGIAPTPVFFALNSKILAIFGALIGFISSAAILALTSYFKL
mgnify:CR=1 FL=1